MTLQEQINESLVGRPVEEHRTILVGLRARWRRDVSEGRIPPGTWWAADVTIEGLLEGLPSVVRRRVTR